MKSSTTTATPIEQARLTYLLQGALLGALGVTAAVLLIAIPWLIVRTVKRRSSPREVPVEEVDGSVSVPLLPNRSQQSAALPCANGDATQSTKQGTRHTENRMTVQPTSTTAPPVRSSGYGSTSAAAAAGVAGAGAAATEELRTTNGASRLTAQRKDSRSLSSGGVTAQTVISDSVHHPTQSSVSMKAPSNSTVAVVEAPSSTRFPATREDSAVNDVKDSSSSTTSGFADRHSPSPTDEQGEVLSEDDQRNLSQSLSSLEERLGDLISQLHDAADEVDEEMEAMKDNVKRSLRAGQMMIATAQREEQVRLQRIVAAESQRQQASSARLPGATPRSATWTPFSTVSSSAQFK